jgi:hypothetical protein
VALIYLTFSYYVIWIVFWYWNVVMLALPWKDKTLSFLAHFSIY